MPCKMTFYFNLQLSVVAENQEAAGDRGQAGQQLSVWTLAWPSVLTNLLYAIVGIVAIKFVAGMGPSTVAAVGAGTQLFYGLQTILLAISTGTTALVARSWGSGDYQEAVRVTLASLAIGLGSALVLSAFCIIFPYEVASIFGLDEVTTRQVADLVTWLSVFNLAFAVNFVLSAALRAAGDARTPLRLAVLTNALNLLFLYPAIFGIEGFLPAQGASGVALAWGLSFSISSMLALVLWVRGALLIEFRWIRFMEKPRISALLHVSYPAGAEQVAIRIGFFVFMALIAKYYGTVPFAAYSVGVNMLSLCFVVGFGFSIAGATLTGQHLGMRDPEGAHRSALSSLKYALASMIGIGLIIVLGAEWIARLLVSDEEIVRYTVIFIYILGAAQPLMAVEFAIGGALRGAGDTRFPLKAVLVGLLGVRLGLTLIAVILEASVVWVYAALLGDYAAKAVILLRRFRGGRWQTALPNYHRGV